MRFQIKTVVRMTGVPRNTLLAWERRYQVVSPERAPNGYRLYSQADVDTLRAVKNLTVKGYKITEALELIRTGGNQDQTTSDTPKLPVAVALLDPSLYSLMDGRLGQNDQRQFSQLQTTVESVLTGDTKERYDVAVVLLENLGQDPINMIRQLQAVSDGKPLVVVYQFAQRRVIDAIHGSGSILLKGPLKVQELMTTLQKISGSSWGTNQMIPISSMDGIRSATMNFETRPDRIFSDLQLMNGTQYQSKVECECPNHLSEIISSLSAFEQYTESCINLSEEDRELHQRLALGTGHVRGIMERLLQEVCEREKIDLDIG